MKIKDILSEDDFGKIANVDQANKKVTIEKPDGTKMDVSSDAVMPKPGAAGQATIDPAAIASDLKPGTVVSTATEDYEEEGQYPGHHDISLHSFMNSEFAPYDDDSGDYHVVHNKARNFLHGKVHRADLEKHAERLNREFHGERDMDETHHDLVRQGNHSVGGDATDNFIDQVRDKGYERAQMKSGQNSRSPIGGDKLKETDELMKWLTIAGLK